MFLPESNPTPHLDHASHSHVPPTIQTLHNTAYTIVLPLYYNALPDEHNQQTTSRQFQPSPREFLSSSSNVPNTCQPPSSIPTTIIPHSPTVFAAPIGQHHATTSHNCQFMSESISPSFHTQISQAPLLVNDHPHAY